MRKSDETIPVWQLYGERTVFPDVLHCERIVDRAAGLDWAIAAHRHVHLHQIFLLKEGDIRLTVDGVHWRVSPPTVVSLPRGAVHGFVFSAGTDGYVITLPASDFPELFANDAEAAAALGRAFSVTATQGLIARVHSLALRHSQASAFRRTLLRAEAMALIADLLAVMLETDLPADRASTADPRMQRFETLVRAHLREKWRIEDYAKALGLSPRHLGRICHAASGQSAKACLEEQIMREGCRLLAYTRMSIQQVGYHLGFEDPSYFSRAFQRNTGIAPSAYRARFET